jgi:enediyne biosynthesis protein E4
VWPSGHKDSLDGIAPDQSLTVEEGKGIVAAHPISFAKK